MKTEQFEFEQSVESLFKGALQAHQDPELAAALREAGLDLGKKLAPAYPAEDFYRWLRLAARYRFSELDEAEACREVGRLAMVRGLRSTLIGGAVLTGMQLLGVRRSLLRVGRNLRNGNNYVEAKSVELSPYSVELQLEPVVGPVTYYEGLLEEGARQMGAKTVQVTQTGRHGQQLTWRVDWTE